jgi:hypothetical protein
MTTTESQLQPLEITEVGGPAKFIDVGFADTFELSGLSTPIRRKPLFAP